MNTDSELHDRIAEALTRWALTYPIPAWSLAQGEDAKKLARNWARAATSFVLEVLPGSQASCGCVDADKTYAQMQADLQGEIERLTVQRDNARALFRMSCEERRDVNDAFRQMQTDLQGEIERLTFQLQCARGELAKADAENNANAARAESAERIMNEAIKTVGQLELELGTAQYLRAQQYERAEWAGEYVRQLRTELGKPNQ